MIKIDSIHIKISSIENNYFSNFQLIIRDLGSLVAKTRSKTLDFSFEAIFGLFIGPFEGTIIDISAFHQSFRKELTSNFGFLEIVIRFSWKVERFLDYLGP